MAGFVAVGYTWGFWTSVLFGRHFKALMRARAPRLFVMGSDDCFTSIRTLRKRVARCIKESGNEYADFEVVQSVGHFALEGPDYDAHVAERIGAFVHRVLRGDFKRSAAATPGDTRSKVEGEATPVAFGCEGGAAAQATQASPVAAAHLPPDARV